MTTIDDLTELVPPPATPPEFDFAACESALGLTLPDDYKDLISVYGCGMFNEDIQIWVPPYQGIEAFRSIEVRGPESRSYIADARPATDGTVWQKQDGSVAHVDLGTQTPPPYFGWGMDSGGHYGFWHQLGDDPNAWPVVYTDLAENWDYDERGLLEYLYAKLTESFPDSATSGGYDPEEPVFDSFY